MVVLHLIYIFGKMVVFHFWGIKVKYYFMLSALLSPFLRKQGSLILMSVYDRYLVTNRTKYSLTEQMGTEVNRFTFYLKTTGVRQMARLPSIFRMNILLAKTVETGLRRICLKMVVDKLLYMFRLKINATIKVFKVILNHIY